MFGRKHKFKNIEFISVKPKYSFKSEHTLVCFEVLEMFRIVLKQHALPF